MIGARLRRITPGFALGLIIPVGFALRAAGLAWGMADATVSARPHPDEWVLYWLFHWFHTQQLFNPCPGANQCFFDWGSIYIDAAYLVHLIMPPALLAALGPFGTADPRFVHAVLTGRLLSLLLSTLTIWVVYRLGRRLGAPPVGLLAALITALFTLLIQLAHFATPDSTTTLLVSLALWACVVALDRPSLPQFALSGLLLGLAVGSEYHMVLLAVPLAVAWWLGGSHRARLLLAATAVSILTYAVTNLYSLLEWRSFLAASLHTLQIRTVESGVQYQGRFNAYGPDWLYLVRFPLGYGAGFALAAWLMAGVLFALSRVRPGLLVLYSWVLAYGLLVSLSPAKFMRYSAPLVPALAVLAALGTVYGWRALAPPLRPLLSLLLSATVLLTLVYDLAYDGLFTRPDTRLQAAAWLRAHARPGARVEFASWPDGVVDLPYYVQDAGFQTCYANFNPRALIGARYALLDRYSLEDHTGATEAQARTFRQRVVSSSRFRLVDRLAPAPHLLWFRFPLAASPHDWRYPDHVVSIYQAVDPGRPTFPCHPPHLEATGATLSRMAPPSH